MSSLEQSRDNEGEDVEVPNSRHIQGARGLLEGRSLSPFSVILEINRSIVKSRNSCEKHKRGKRTCQKL